MARGSGSTPITPGGFAELVAIDLRKVFVETGDERPREYPEYIHVETLDHLPATDQQVHGLGPMGAKPIGSPFPRQYPIMGGRKSWDASPFGSAVELTFEGFRDEQYGVFREIPKEQARAGREREELAAVSLLDNAFDTAFDGYVSGESLCGDHVGIDGVTRRNRPNPDIGFSITGLQQMVLHFHGLTDDQGKRTLMTASKIILHANDIFTAREILGTSGKPYTPDNTINSLVAENLSWWVSHFKASTTSWFAQATNHDAYFMWRDMPMQNTFNEPNTMNSVTTAYQRHGVGEFGTWRGWYGSNP